jgi:hypothetical protein
LLRPGGARLWLAPWHGRRPDAARQGDLLRHSEGSGCMFSLSADMAIDLGTANTLVYVKGSAASS